MPRLLTTRNAARKPSSEAPSGRKATGLPLQEGPDEPPEGQASDRQRDGDSVPVPVSKGMQATTPSGTDTTASTEGVQGVEGTLPVHRAGDQADDDGGERAHTAVAGPGGAADVVDRRPRGRRVASQRSWPTDPEIASQPDPGRTQPGR